MDHGKLPPCVRRVGTDLVRGCTGVDAVAHWPIIQNFGCTGLIAVRTCGSMLQINLVPQRCCAGSG